MRAIPRVSRLANYIREGDLPIYANRISRGPHRALDFHSHDYSELVLVAQGGAVHIVDGRPAPVKKGDVLLLHPGRVHGYDKTGDFEIFNILYKKEALFVPGLDCERLPFFRSIFIEKDARDETRGNPEKPVLSLGKSEFRSVERLARELCEELNGTRPARQFRALALFMDMVAVLARNGEQATSEGQLRIQIGDAVALMNSKFNKKLSIEELARAAKMSKRNFFIQFKRCMGCAPMDYVSNARLWKAACLLRETSMNLNEIAFVCGFCDANHLCKRFHERYGTSPGKHRRLQTASDCKI